jgi:ABC-type Fe3+/spermidine/putrescine transport system ATPase subunit
VQPHIQIESLSKRFGTLAAVEGLSLEIPRGDLLALLGPSGSGKTTTLRLLAGFEVPDQGRIRVDGQDVTDLAPAARRFGMVFQHYALFPHLDVGENVAFGLEAQRVPPAERRQRVAESLELVELAGFERRPVGALSGGQQQRVALARALAPAPRVLLLDEPLSNLDPTLRERTRRELRVLIERIGITTILVTHEQEEAFDLADHVAVLQRGRLEQLGTPEQLYQVPATAFVAGFIGRARAVPVRVVAHERDVARVLLPGATVPWDVRQATPLEGACDLYVRPEALRLAPPGEGVVSGVVLARRFLGADALYTVGQEEGSRAGREGWILEVLGVPEAATVGDRVGILPGARGLHLFLAGER